MKGQLSDDDVREVRRLVLRQGGLSARRWLEQKGFDPNEAKALVDPFLDEDVVASTPLWDLLVGAALLLVGIGLTIGTYAAARSEGGGTWWLFYGAIIFGSLLLLRGLWLAARYLLAYWKG